METSILEWVPPSKLPFSPKTLQRRRADSWPENLVWRRVNDRLIVYHRGGVNAWLGGPEEFKLWLHKAQAERQATLRSLDKAS